MYNIVQRWQAKKNGNDARKIKYINYDFLKLNNQTERNCEFRKSSFNWMEWKRADASRLRMSKKCVHLRLSVLFFFCLIVYCESARFSMVLNTMFLADVSTFLVRIAWNNDETLCRARERQKYQSSPANRVADKITFACLGRPEIKVKVTGMLSSMNHSQSRAHNIFDKCHKLREEHTKQKRFNHLM